MNLNTDLFRTCDMNSVSTSDMNDSDDLAFDEDGSESITAEERHREEERRVTSTTQLIIRLTLVRKVRHFRWFLCCERFEGGKNEAKVEKLITWQTFSGQVLITKGPDLP